MPKTTPGALAMRAARLRKKRDSGRQLSAAESQWLQVYEQQHPNPRAKRDAPAVAVQVVEALPVDDAGDVDAAAIVMQGQRLDAILALCLDSQKQTLQAWKDLAREQSARMAIIEKTWLDSLLQLHALILENARVRAEAATKAATPDDEMDEMAKQFFGQFMAKQLAGAGAGESANGAKGARKK
jgi:hypothetical protein